ncbi:MAG: SH3 domain-containing protein [Deltaproteobacteria bacterium]|nr:SH3 domain-containing protein [Deltaproteobacteria bacterium]
MMRPGRFIAVTVFVSLCIVFSVIAAPPKTMSVQVKEGQVRSNPSFLAEIVARPSYGDRVEIIQDKGAWKKVALRGVQGWMHTSALTTKSIVLRAGTAVTQTGAGGSEVALAGKADLPPTSSGGQGVTTGEIALAGKGFSEEVEKQYKSLNPKLDYAWVDKMEKFKVSPEQMQAFLKRGSVKPAEGGVQ